MDEVTAQITVRNARIKRLMRLFNCSYATASQLYSALNKLRKQAGGSSNDNDR